MLGDTSADTQLLHDSERTPEGTTPELTPLPAESLSAEFLPASETASLFVFGLRDSLYALDALSVREVHWLPFLTPMAQTEPFVVGVVNLRGRVLPVLDLAQRLGYAPQDARLDDCLVVLEEGESSLGVLVNAVHGVQSVAPSQLEPAPVRSEGPSHEVAGVARLHDEVVVLLSARALIFGSAGQTSAGSSAGIWQALPEDAEQFRERARRLMPPAEAQASGSVLPVALVCLHGEEYGIELGSVREFCELRQVTLVPCCPPHIVGQMNLRGDIVTLIDVQPLLQMPARAASAASANSTHHECSVVVVQSEDAPVGILIDGVRDVVYLGEGELGPAPVPASSAGARYFSGGVLREGRAI